MAELSTELMAPAQERDGFFRRAGDRLGSFFGNVGRGLGDALDVVSGGPAARERGYAAGLQERSQSEAVLAQRDAALALARQRQQESRRLESERIAQSRLGYSLATALGVPLYEAEPLADIMRSGMAGDFRSLTLGRGDTQEQGFRADIANPELADEMRLARMEALAPAAGVNQRLGEAFDRPRTPPSGYRWTESGDLEPVPGGPADPSMRGTGRTPLDVAEEAYLRNLASELGSYSSMPETHPRYVSPEDAARMVTGFSDRFRSPATPESPADAPDLIAPYLTGDDWLERLSADAEDAIARGADPARVQERTAEVRRQIEELRRDRGELWER